MSKSQKPVKGSKVGDSNIPYASTPTPMPGYITPEPTACQAPQMFTPTPMPTPTPPYTPTPLPTTAPTWEATPPVYNTPFYTPTPIDMPTPTPEQAYKMILADFGFDEKPKPRNQYDLSYLFREEPISKTILSEVKTDDWNRIIKTMLSYGSMGQEDQLKQLERVHRRIVEGRDGVMITGDDGPKDLCARLDEGESTALLEASFYVQAMRAVPCRNPDHVMDARKMKYQSMANELEGMLKGHYTQERLDWSRFGEFFNQNFMVSN